MLKIKCLFKCWDFVEQGRLALSNCMLEIDIYETNRLPAQLNKNDYRARGSPDNLVRCTGR